MWYLDIFSQEFVIVLYQNERLEEHWHEVPSTKRRLDKEYLELSKEKIRRKCNFIIC